MYINLLNLLKKLATKSIVVLWEMIKVWFMKIMVK